MVIFNSYVKLPEGKSTGICGNGRHPRPVCSPHPGSQHQSSLQDDVAEIWQTTGSAIYYLHAVRANPFNTSAMPQSVMFGVFFADHSDIRGHCSEMDGPVVILVIYSNLIIYHFVQCWTLFWGWPGFLHSFYTLSIHLSLCGAKSLIILMYDSPIHLLSYLVTSLSLITCFVLHSQSSIYQFWLPNFVNFDHQSSFVKSFSRLSPNYEVISRLLNYFDPTKINTNIELVFNKS